MNKPFIRPFFREESLQNKRNNLCGDILLLPKISHTLLITLLVIWLCGVIALLTQSSYNKKETVSGWVASSSSSLKVFVPQNGMVENLYVKEGDQVAKGQTLLNIVTLPRTTKGIDLQAQALVDYERQKNRIIQQTSRRQSMNEKQTQEVEAKLDAFTKELESITKQLTTLKKRHDLQQASTLKARQLYANGGISLASIEQIESQLLLLQEDLYVLERSEISKKLEIDSLYSALEMLPIQLAGDLSQLSERLDSITQQINIVEQTRAYSLTAPQAGTISNLQVHSGGNVEADTTRPIFSISPLQSDFFLQILVPVSASGFIQAGQTINIRYDAFPYQKYGSYLGEISIVSNTLLLPEELIDAPILANEPVFKVLAKIENNSNETSESILNLRNGMTFQADIVLDERTIFEWLIEPIISIAKKR